MTDQIKPAISQTQAQQVIASGLSEYADRRISSYTDLKLKRLLQKDVLMLAMRGVSDSTEFIDAAFTAFESSSEEGMMGDFWQTVAKDLTTNSIDLSDLVVERGSDIWIVEIKAQTNTITGRFRKDLLLSMKRRVEAMSRPRRIRRGSVRAMLGVIRGPATDRLVTCKSGPDEVARELAGFTYTYKVGAPLWEWLTGIPSMTSLIQTIPDDAARLTEARNSALARMHREMEQALDARGSARDILTLMRLVEDALG